MPLSNADESDLMPWEETKPAITNYSKPLSPELESQWKSAQQEYDRQPSSNSVTLPPIKPAGERASVNSLQTPPLMQDKPKNSSKSRDVGTKHDQAALKVAVGRSKDFTVAPSPFNGAIRSRSVPHSASPHDNLKSAGNQDLAPRSKSQLCVSEPNEDERRKRAKWAQQKRNMEEKRLKEIAEKAAAEEMKRRELEQQRLEARRAAVRDRIIKQHEMHAKMVEDRQKSLESVKQWQQNFKGKPLYEKFQEEYERELIRIENEKRKELENHRHKKLSPSAEGNAKSQGGDESLPQEAGAKGAGPRYGSPGQGVVHARAMLHAYKPHGKTSMDHHRKSRAVLVDRASSPIILGSDGLPIVPQLSMEQSFLQIQVEDPQRMPLGAVQNNVSGRRVLPPLNHSSSSGHTADQAPHSEPGSFKHNGIKSLEPLVHKGKGESARGAPKQEALKDVHSQKPPKPNQEARKPAASARSGKDKNKSARPSKNGKEQAQHRNANPGAEANENMRQDSPLGKEADDQPQKISAYGSESGAMQHDQPQRTSVYGSEVGGLQHDQPYRISAYGSENGTMQQEQPQRTSAYGHDDGVMQHGSAPEPRLSVAGEAPDEDPAAREARLSMAGQAEGAETYEGAEQELFGAEQGRVSGSGQEDPQESVSGQVLEGSPAEHTRISHAGQGYERFSHGGQMEAEADIEMASPREDVVMADAARDEEPNNEAELQTEPIGDFEQEQDQNEAPTEAGTGANADDNPSSRSSHPGHMDMQTEDGAAELLVDEHASRHESAHGTSTSGVRLTSTSGAHPTSSSGAHTTSMNGAHTTSTSGAHTTSTGGAHTTSTGGAHTTSTSGGHTTSTSGGHTTSTSGAHTTSTSGAHTTSTSGAHTTSTSGGHTTSTSGAHTTSTSGAHTTSTSGARVTSMSGADNASTSGAQSHSHSGSTQQANHSHPHGALADHSQETSEAHHTTGNHHTEEPKVDGLEGEIRHLLEGGMKSTKGVIEMIEEEDEDELEKRFNSALGNLGIDDNEGKEPRESQGGGPAKQRTNEVSHSGKGEEEGPKSSAKAADGGDEPENAGGTAGTEDPESNTAADLPLGGSGGQLDDLLEPAADDVPSAIGEETREAIEENVDDDYGKDDFEAELPEAGMGGKGDEQDQYAADDSLLQPSGTFMGDETQDELQQGTTFESGVDGGLADGPQQRGGDDGTLEAQQEEGEGEGNVGQQGASVDEP